MYTDNELLELLVQNRERHARLLRLVCKKADEVAATLGDYWKNQAGGNE